MRQQLVTVEAWKYLLFKSEETNESTRDFCRQKISSLLSCSSKAIFKEFTAARLSSDGDKPCLQSLEKAASYCLEYVRKIVYSIPKGHDEGSNFMKNTKSKITTNRIVPSRFHHNIKGVVSKPKLFEFEQSR